MLPELALDPILSNYDDRHSRYMTDSGLSSDGLGDDYQWIGVGEVMY